MSKQRPILYATHDNEDGLWQFLCGENDHTEENVNVISLKNATLIDTTINELFEMPLGVGAERKNINSKWIAFRLQD